ncbi:MAG: phosphotransferase [Bacilli bacterium]
MNKADLNVDFGDICSFIGIGSALRRPELVTGGLLHRIWRVETENGIFAVKVLNQEIMSRPDAKQNFRIAERVAKIANNNGICAVIAKTVGNDPWIESNGSYVMVFDWVDGRTLRPEECTSEHAMRIGEILFQIHRLNIVIDGLEPPTWSAIPEDTWKSHIEKVRQSISCWELPWETLLHDVINWCRLFQDAADRLSRRLIISHGDLDSKNVIWNDEQTPYVIDWESAGYVNPTVELIEAALNWSRNQDGTSDKTRFQAVIQSYVQAGGSLYGKVLDALYGTLGGMLGWLEYNMRRSVDEDVFGSDERDLAQREVKQTAHQLKKMVDIVFDYAQWIEEISG